MAVTHEILADFQNSFTGWFSNIFAVKWLLKIPPHVKCVATLPCEICVQEIAMLTNCVNKLPCKTQTAMQDSSTENYSRKILV